MSDSCLIHPSFHVKLLLLRAADQLDLALCSRVLQLYYELRLFALKDFHFFI